MFPTLNDLTPIARIHKSYGTNGAISVVFSFNPENIELKEPMFIIFDGLLVPFFISDIKLKGRGKAIIKLEGIDTLYDADNIIGENIYFSNKILKKDEDLENLDDNIDIFKLVDFQIFNKDELPIGKIKQIHDYSGNICFEINKSDNSILIPYHDDILIELDIENKKIRLDIPDGLIF